MPLRTTTRPRSCPQGGCALAPMIRKPARRSCKQKSMRLTATARSTPGTLRQQVVIDGRHHLITDEPEHLGGDGSGPAPH